MNIKQIISAIVAIGGIAALFVASHIKNLVGEGKKQVSEAQSKTDLADSLFSLHPVAKEVGQGAITDPARQKIGEGILTIAQYEKLANYLQLGGIIAIVLGSGAVFFFRSKKEG
jgi:hypothetical protein